MSKSLVIFSNAYKRREVSGPWKVVTSVVRGLEEEKVAFSVNKLPLHRDSTIWIHDSLPAVWDFRRRKGRVIGPNCFVLPRDCPRVLLKNAIHLQPSQWAADVWLQQPGGKLDVQVWPAGIEMDKFPERQRPADGKVLVYFKERSEDELAFAEESLRREGLAYELIRYGSYDEDEFRTKLAAAKFLIWLGRYESQGIALQEALCSGVPILVWDCTSLGQQVPFPLAYWDESMRKMASTAAPYFDETCGELIGDRSQLAEKLRKLSASVDQYQPRAFVQKNLNHRKQARELLAKCPPGPEGLGSINYVPSTSGRIFARAVHLRYRIRRRLLG